MKKIISIVIVLALIFALAACGNNNAPAPEPAAPAPAPAETGGGDDGGGNAVSDLIVGYNAGSDYIEFFINVIGGLQAEADKAGIGFVSVVSDFDPEKIMPNTEQLLQKGAQIIIDFNVNNEVGANIVKVVEERGGAGVISIDVEYVGAWFMGINNQRAGELAGEAIAQALTDQNRELEYLVLFFNSENGDLVKKRMGGAIDGLANKGVTIDESRIEWIDMGGGGSDTTIVGKDKFSAWLTAHPDVRTVATVAVNDETTQGLWSAAETANRTQDCLMTSHNVSEQFKQLALQGNDGKTWLGSVAYHPEQYGEYIIPLAIDIWQGKNVDPTTHVLMDPAWVPMSKTAIDAYIADFDAYTASW